MNGKNIYTAATRGPEETEAVGAAVGRAVLAAGGHPFIAMYGDLGAGKTVFVRGLCSVLSPGSRVKSPTYTLVNEYRRGPVPFFHFDLYRIGSSEELDGFGFEEYQTKGICAAEWSEKLGEELPPDAVIIRIEKTGEDSRLITVEGLPMEELSPTEEENA